MENLDSDYKTSVYCQSVDLSPNKLVIPIMSLKPQTSNYNQYVEKLKIPRPMSAFSRNSKKGKTMIEKVKIERPSSARQLFKGNPYFTKGVNK